MANLKATVSVEQVVHDMFAHLTQDLFEEHGIKTNKVEFNWADVTEMGLDGKKELILTGVKIESETFGTVVVKEG